MEETRSQIPLTIVRPSIIESSWKSPTSGWIRGFRMAEPIILNFGKGTLKEFPGIPEGIVDIIPVDLVSSAIIACAAQEPSSDTTIYQVASEAVTRFEHQSSLTTFTSFLERIRYMMKTNLSLLQNGGFG